MLEVLLQDRKIDKRCVEYVQVTDILLFDYI